MEMEKRRKSSLKLPTVLFFVFAILCVLAFLIVILVKSCDADHEENELIDQVENQVAMIHITPDRPITMIG